MQILFEKLSIIKEKKDEIYYINFNAEAIFRLFKLLKEDKYFKEKHNRV